MTADIDFTAFFDAHVGPYLVLDADLVIRYVNAASCGSPTHTWTGARPATLCPPL